MSTSASETIACILGLETLKPRVALIRQLTDQYLVRHELTGRALLLRFRPAAYAGLARIVALENSCCAFFAFRLARDVEGCELTVTSPEGTEDAMRWLAAQLLPDPAT